MWSIAIYDLQLKNNEFWDLCPCEFDALLERWILHQEREENRMARICQTIVAMNKGKRGQSPKLEHFYVYKFRDKPIQSPTDQLAVLQQFGNVFKSKR